MTAAFASCIGETRAFSIEEHELALRWATLVKHSGYQVAVSLCQRGAEELLLVSRSDKDVLAFAIQPLPTTVVVIDRLGITIRFVSLAEALVAISPMSKSERHELIHGPRPACVRELPQSLIEQRQSFGRRVVSAFRQRTRHTRRWAAWLAARPWSHNK